MIVSTRLIAVIALVGLAFPLAAQAQSTTTEGTVAGWTRMILREENGTPWACGIEKRGTDGTEIGALVSPDSFFLISLSKASWQLKKGASYPISYSIDRGRRVSTTAKALMTIGVVFAPEDLENFIGNFYSGQTLSIHTAQQTFSVSLRGSAKSTIWLADCLDRIKGGSRRNDPFSR